MFGILDCRAPTGDILGFEPSSRKRDIGPHLDVHVLTTAPVNTGRRQRVSAVPHQLCRVGIRPIVNLITSKQLIVIFCRRNFVIHMNSVEKKMIETTFPSAL